MQAASLLGEFDRPLLSVMLGLSPHEIDHAVMAAAALGLLELDGGPRFAHSQLRAWRGPRYRVHLRSSGTATRRTNCCGVAPGRSGRHVTSSRSSPGPSRLGARVVCRGSRGHARWATCRPGSHCFGAPSWNHPHDISCPTCARRSSPASSRSTILRGGSRWPARKPSIQRSSIDLKPPLAGPRTCEGTRRVPRFCCAARGRAFRTRRATRRSECSPSGPSSTGSESTWTSASSLTSRRWQATLMDPIGPPSERCRRTSPTSGHSAVVAPRQWSVSPLAAFDPQRVDADELIRNAGLIVGLLALMFVDATAEFDEVVTRVRPEAGATRHADARRRHRQRRGC